MINPPKNIPKLPCVYLFKSEKGKVLYVGKAKNLKNRIRSYFQKNIPDPYKTKMVEKAKALEFIICENEEEALILEMNLRKSMLSQ